MSDDPLDAMAGPISSSLPAWLWEVPVTPAISAEQRSAAARGQRFLDEVLLPLETSLADLELDPLPEGLETRLSVRAREYGLWGVATPKDLGGQGLGQLGYVLVRERVAQCIVGDVRHELGVGGDPWPALYLAQGNQRARFLDPVLAGAKRPFFALTEPQAGSDPAGIRTQATKVDGGWLVNGHKKWIGRSGTTHFGVVFAVTDPERLVDGGVTAFFVEPGTPGFSVMRSIRTIGAARPNELRFDNCFIPDDDVLGEVGLALRYANETLGVQRVRQAVLNVAAATRAFALLARWLPSRVTFGEPLANREALRWRLARASVDLESVRRMMYSVAARIDKGEACGAEVPVLKTLAAQMAGRLTDLAVQLHGALGVSEDAPLERLARDVRAFRITEGGDEVQRQAIADGLMAAARS